MIKRIAGFINQTILSCYVRLFTAPLTWHQAPAPTSRVDGGK